MTVTVILFRWRTNSEHPCLLLGLRYTRQIVPLLTCVIGKSPSFPWIDLFTLSNPLSTKSFRQWADNNFFITAITSFCSSCSRSDKNSYAVCTISTWMVSDDLLLVVTYWIVGLMSAFSWVAIRFSVCSRQSEFTLSRIRAVFHRLKFP